MAAPAADLSPPIRWEEKGRRKLGNGECSRGSDARSNSLRILAYLVPLLITRLEWASLRPPPGRFRVIGAVKYVKGVAWIGVRIRN